MLNITTIEDALYDWVYEISGVTTIFAHPNAPRPKTSYVLINLFQNIPLGVEETQYEEGADETTDVDYSNIEVLSVSINTYYTGAYQLATKLKDSLGRVTIQDNLFSAGIGYSRAAAVQEIPEEINKQWEERAQFDCFFFARSLDEENIETIQKVQITNELDGGSIIIPYPILNWVDRSLQIWPDRNNQTWIDR